MGRRPVKTSPLSIAKRFLGLREEPGAKSNPLVLAMLQRAAPWVKDDAVAWCGAFAGGVAWLLDLERPADHLALAARRWLAVGTPVLLEDAEPGFDVVILKRGDGQQPGPEVLDAPGHVGFYDGRHGDLRIWLVGGNQGDSVSRSSFDAGRVLGVRRLSPVVHVEEEEDAAT